MSVVVGRIFGAKAVVVAIALFIVLLASWAYAPALGVSFVFDDRQNIVDSPAVHWTEFSRASLGSLLDASRLQSRPVANLSFALDHLRGGLEPRVFHVTNILIHFGVALALLWLTLLYVRLAKPIPDRGAPYPRSAALALLAIGIFLLLPVLLMLVYSFLTKDFRGGVIWECQPAGRSGPWSENAKPPLCARSGHSRTRASSTLLMRPTKPLPD